MMGVIKKIVTSKWFKFVFSVVLIYLAFRKINVVKLFDEVSQVDLKVVVLILIYYSITMVIGGYRWSLVVLPKVNFNDVLVFTKATYMGAFYSLFFPSAVGGDLLKWIPLLKKYPELSKTRLAASVLVDRVIGFTTFAIVALLALLLGRLRGYVFPDFILWLFLVINFGVIIFYGVVYLTDMDKYLDRFSKLRKVDEIISILKKENKKRIFKCLGISLITEPVWILSSWFAALVFHVPMSPLQVFIFIPIISLILVLPISVAGFGARENLYLYFLSQLGFGTEKILLMSTFNGIMLVINNLLGGIFLLF